MRLYQATESIAASNASSVAAAEKKTVISVCFFSITKREVSVL